MPSKGPRLARLFTINMTYPYLFRSVNKENTGSERISINVQDRLYNKIYREFKF